MTARQPILVEALQSGRLRLLGIDPAAGSDNTVLSSLRDLRDQPDIYLVAGIDDQGREFRERIILQRGDQVLLRRGVDAIQREQDLAEMIDLAPIYRSADLPVQWVDRPVNRAERRRVRRGLPALAGTAKKRR